MLLDAFRRLHTKPRSNNMSNILDRLARALVHSSGLFYCLIGDSNLSGILWDFPCYMHIWTESVDVIWVVLHTRSVKCVLIYDGV